MLDTSGGDLRTRLRHETRPSHDRLDARVGALDLTIALDYGFFLQGQRFGLAGLLQQTGCGSHVSATELAEMVAALDDDLASLGADPMNKTATLSAVHPLALDYIVLGSRLGTAVLKQQWQLTRDPSVMAASAYFSLPALGTSWRAFCDEVGQMSGFTAEADQIVSDVTRVFDLFELGFAEAGA